MNKPAEHGVDKAVDTIQQSLTDYAMALRFEDLPPDVVHGTTARVIDTLGALMGGFFSDPSRMARNVAAAMPMPAGATIIGTRMKTAPDMAAFVNGATARYVEMNDIYHWPKSFGGHPSDVLMPVFAAAEHVNASGRELITAVVLAYEVYQSFSNVFENKGMGFDHTNFACLGSSVGAGKLLGLTREQLAHCISMAAVPNVILRQVRADHYTMWKAVASGQAGRGGVFAAMLARAGMEGPHLPFEGKAGWCNHVARDNIVLSLDGRNGMPFKILHSLIKNRSSCGKTIASILAAEKVAPVDFKKVKKVTVALDKLAKDRLGTGEHRWHPDTREGADHSIPYVVAATLMDGTVTPRSFNDAHLWNPDLRALIQKVECVIDDDFTRRYVKIPVEHCARVTVELENGERMTGETGGDEDDLSTPKTDVQFVDKFRGLTEDFLGSRRVSQALEMLWSLDSMKDVSAIPPVFVLD